MAVLLWLIWLPLLFLPNFGHQGNTAFGVLELSDFLIAPYLVLVFLGSRAKGGSLSNRLVPPLFLFLCWALLSTLSISARYMYGDNYLPMLGGLLKLGKLALYAAAGLLTSRAAVNERARKWLPWSLLACGVVMGGALILLPEGSSQTFDSTGVLAGYKANNIINAALAIVGCYLGAFWMLGRGTFVWRRAAIAGFGVMLVGLLLSSRQGGHGRGGWLALGAGLLYFGYKRGLRKDVVFGITGIVALVLVAYVSLPQFRTVLDATINPDADYVATYHASVGGIDDGARVVTWQNEMPKLLDAPILGTGFFHRGGESPLWTSGSHNFFIQMFLETGLVGGALILIVFGAMWKMAGSVEARRAGLGLPARSAIVAAFVGGMSGEYFYGGIVLLILFACIAPVGALRPEQAALRRAIAGGEAKAAA